MTGSGYTEISVPSVIVKLVRHPRHSRYHYGLDNKDAVQNHSGPGHLVRPDLPHNAYLSHFGHALRIMQYSRIFGVPKLGMPKSDAFSRICIIGICIISISTV